MFEIREMRPEDVEGAVALQKLAFPPPFSEELHWDPEHLLGHIETFPDGQFVAVIEGQIVGTCSNTIITEERWQAHENWGRTVGGPDIRGFRRNGTTLYGLDITVHPEMRRQGVGRAFYETRFALVKRVGLTRYGTGCRMPDYKLNHKLNPDLTPEFYAEEVAAGRLTDRTMTPLLRYGLDFIGLVREYMPDPESANCGALLERVI